MLTDTGPTLTAVAVTVLQHFVKIFIKILIKAFYYLTCPVMLLFSISNPPSMSLQRSC